jgi:hypothetical protein
MSPYKDQLATAKLFMDALDTRQKDIPNLISAHLGDRVPTNMNMASAQPVAQPPAAATAPVDPKAKGAASPIVALPLGGRVKMDPWSDKLEMLKAKPVGTVAERERMPFEVTPFMLYLTRTGNTTSELNTPGASADSKAAAANQTPTAKK